MTYEAPRFSIVYSSSACLTRFDNGLQWALRDNGIRWTGGALCARGLRHGRLIRQFECSGLSRGRRRATPSATAATPGEAGTTP